jgi:small-conductance mechanosensitive channel/CRP-like cAMP-binding protein
VTPWQATLAEARNDETLLLVGGLIFLGLIVRAAAPEEGGRLRVALWFLGLHLLLLPAAGTLHAYEFSSYTELHLVTLMFGVLAAIEVTACFVFAVALPRAGLRSPRILRDILVAAASVVMVFVLGSRAGLNLSGLIATSTVITAVVGLSLQDTLGNVMAGLFLQMDQSVQVGDWLKVGDLSGLVTETRWRYTSVETRNWETLIIPNGTLVRNQFLVLGRRHGRPRQWRRWVYFNVDFRYSPSDVIGAVSESLLAAPIVNVAPEPAPNCILIDLHESYGRYAARYWLTDLSVDDPTDSAVRVRIYFALKRVGIPLSIPAHAIFMTEETQERKAIKSEEEERRRLQALSNVNVFDHLSDADKQRLAAGLRYAPFARGEVMTRQGAVAHWLYMILTGRVSVRVAGERGVEREVSRLEAPGFFGEMSLMTGEPRAATVIALTDVECYRLDAATFQEIIREHPELAEKVAEVLAQRRADLLAAIEQLGVEAQARAAVSKHDLLRQIKVFFGIGSAPGRS